MRDQAMLFLKMIPDTQEYINEVLATLDDMVDILGRRLTIVKD